MSPQPHPLADLPPYARVSRSHRIGNCASPRVSLDVMADRTFLVFTGKLTLVFSLVTSHCNLLIKLSQLTTSLLN
jgi:hypothetical protein